MFKFSDEDNDLRGIDWITHTAGYAIYKHKFAHRIVLARMLGRPLTSKDITDHINRDKTDNRRNNLRLADKSINAVNTKDKPNKSGYRGVYKSHPQEYKLKGWRPMYCFRIYRKGHKVFNSKYYKTPLEAHEARLIKLAEYDY